MDPNLDQVLENLMKRGAVPTRAQHLQIARTNMKKARKARDDAMDSIKAAHAMHKSAYLSKAGKNGKKPPADDADDFDHEDAMGKLSKAYASLDTMKTFMKAANNHLKKAAGRTGQSGQEVGDSNQWYAKPSGVKDMTQSELTDAGPGGGESGSEPPILGMESVFPGKNAKKAAKTNGGLITKEHADLLVRAATAEAEAKLLKSMPANPNGRKPLPFDVSKFAGNNGNDAAAAAILDGVDANGLVSDDENARKVAVGRLVGNMITNGTGRSVFDPAFHGTAGGSR